MCRIAGVLASKLSIQQTEHNVRMMCDVMQHGGPDDEGFFADEQSGIVFGHRRLSIIDLSKNGHQPMADTGQKNRITFNGEIYNYPELKQQLVALGAGFQSNTDTEVILMAYLHWGVEAFQKLRGMFAFALYDAERKVTYLVRDVAGIKPLYYHIKNNQLTFASEVKALKQIGITDIDNAWKVRFLAFGHIPEPYTTLKDVYSLPKGHYLQWEHNNNSYSINSYSYAKSVGHIISADEAVVKIYDAVSTAVERQLIADASIGVFLSGGIDSSIITLLAGQIKQEQLNTISVYFNDKNFDERAYQNLVSANIKGNKYTHLVSETDFETNFPAIINAMDMPTTDGINTWFISKFAHDDGLKSVLSGLGADELFGGYPSFKWIAHIQQLRKIPKKLFKTAAMLPFDKYRRISFLAHDHPVADYLFLRGLFIPQDIADILDTDLKQVNDILFNENAAHFPQTYNQEHAAWLETNLYMQNQLLHDTDVMSMSHGIEVRVPFLDEDLQTIVHSISRAIRFDSRQPKKLLVDSFKKILPRAVWDRPKMGFTFPLQQWMSVQPAISSEELYAGKHARNIISKFKRGQIHWSKAYALYQLQNA